jgi:riboflavin transporter FmnP
MLAAVSCVLFLFQIGTPLTPGYLKLDLSDLPALLASMTFGAPYGVLVCLVKNAVGLLHSMTSGVGELSNFVLSSAFVLTAGLLYRRRRTLKAAVVGALLGAAVAAVVSVPSNYYLVYPIYGKVMPMEAIMGMYQAIVPRIEKLWQALWIFNAPFTFAKGLLCALVTLWIYEPLQPLLVGDRHN